MSVTPQPSKGKRLLFTLILIVLVPTMAFVLFEGGSSGVLLAMDLFRAGWIPPERKYSHYDSLLGWVSTPKTVIRGMYGPGADLHINGQGFRSKREFARQPGPGRVRVICSGNSFTLGFGVDDDATWCERLGVLEPRLEPVNMGQAGYGLDQAYLWYRRDGVALHPDIHILAFIWAVIGRVGDSNISGYGKPVLAVKDGELEVHNVPVPETAYHAPLLTSWLRGSRIALRPLRSFELGRRVRAALTDRGAVRAVGDSVILATAAKIVEEAAALNRARRTVLVLVHLPAEDDAERPGHDYWNRELRALADRLELPYLDLGQDLRRLPPDSAARIFIPNDGHYTELGNAWAAARIVEGLRRSPQVKQVLVRAE